MGHAYYEPASFDINRGENSYYFQSEGGLFEKYTITTFPGGRVQALSRETWLKCWREDKLPWEL